MKVLQLIQKQQFRGAEVFTSQLSNHLIDNGKEAIVVPVFDGIAELPFKGIIIPLHGVQKKKYWDIKAWKRLAQIIREEQPDIVQANAGDTLHYAVLSKIFFGWNQPIILRNASTISLYLKKNLAKKLYGFFFSKAALIVSVSKTSAIDFENLYPKLKERIIHIPIGIETIGYEKSNLEEYKNRNNEPILLHVGGFSFEKNHKGLIAIFEEVLKKYPNSSLHLVGDGSLKDDIELLVKQKSLTNHVVFHGYQKNPLKYIANADLLLLPSIIEGLPGVILEAFYCKTPVVAYDVGGIKEVVINNKTGRLVKNGSTIEFVDNIFKALEKNKQNEEMIQNAYELVTTKYLNKHVTQQFLLAYQNMINSTSSVSNILI